MNQFNTRKILSGIVLLGVGVLVVYWKGDLPTNFSSFMQTLYGAFVVGNLGEHFTNAYISSKQNEKD